MSGVRLIASSLCKRIKQGMCGSLAGLTDADFNGIQSVLLIGIQFSSEN